jgi:hypothetical protein
MGDGRWAMGDGRWAMGDEINVAAGPQPTISNWQSAISNLVRCVQ